ncbi:MAG: apolipoprotein N-acyltransferase [Candidatus Binatia bacterium]
MPQLAAVVVAAVMFTVLYDPFHAGTVVFLALTPITLVLTNKTWECSLLRAAMFGFIFGLLAALGIVGPWMYSASVDYFDQGSLWSLGFTVWVNAGYVALLYAPAFVALRLLAWAPPVVRVFGVASVWITCETLRAADPAGNAWATLGQSFAHIPLLREAAAYGGEPLLGWVAALCGAAVGTGLQPDVDARSSRVCMFIAFGSPLLLMLLGGVEQWRDPELSPIQPLRVAVVQAEIPSRDVWDPAQRMANWNAYISATEGLHPGSVDLVVWPESAAPFLLDADATSRNRLVELAKSTGAAIMLGAPRSEDLGNGRAALYNSVYFFAPGADQPRTYDKRRLLPYVESSPVTGSEIPDTSDYRAGESAQWFDVRGWRIAPLICFEAVYRQYAREAVLNGASLLVNLSNDAWFAGGAGPEQHHAMSLMRTVELRRSMVRASNGGISGAFGPDGKEIGFPIVRHKAVGLYTIPSPSRRMTIAATLPGLIPGMAGLMAAFSMLYGLRRRWNARHEEA